MKKKILWMLLSFLLVASLVLASCAKAEVVEEEEEEEEPVVVEEEEEEEEEVVEPAVGVPQYGGTITIVYRSGITAGNPDPDSDWGSWPAMLYRGPVLDVPWRGDFEKYGPRGTDEHPFAGEVVPRIEHMTGVLVESWDITPDRIVLHIRPEIIWAAMGKEHVMESREYTADDYVFNLMRQHGDSIEIPLLGTWMGWVVFVLPEELPAGTRALLVSGYAEDTYWPMIYAVDKYTVVIETLAFTDRWYVELLAYLGRQIPPEVVEAGADRWENLVGTGPFIVDEHVHGSFIRYARNPDYWKKATINGKEYEIPFVDYLVMPIIEDMPTQVAALRTGTIDAHLWLDGVYVEELDQNCPELMKASLPLAGVYTLDFRVDIEPTDDINVRRALIIGTDRAALSRAALGVYPMTHDYPIFQGQEGWVPLEELPAENRLLLEYNPKLARQMLADAGYPDGFKAKILAPGGGVYLRILDLVEMLAGMWEEDLGLEVELEVLEFPVFINRITESEHPPFICHWQGTGVAAIAEHIGANNRHEYDNEYATELMFKAKETMDSAKRTVMREELFVIILDEALAVPFGVPPNYARWWPWLKNYYGEIYTGLHDPPYEYIWLDQDLKAEMGY